MAGNSTIGKGDTSRPGVRGDKKGGGYGVYTEKTYSNIGSKGNNLAGNTSIAPAPKAAPGKGNPPANLPKPTGVQTVTPVRAKNIPRSYVPSRIKQIFDPTPFATPVVKKPVVTTKPTIRGSTTPTKKATPRTKPSATRFGTVTGKTTGTTMGGGGGYGGGGTRGGGSLSGQGSGSRTAGTSRTGGTRNNDTVR